LSIRLSLEVRNGWMQFVTQLRKRTGWDWRWRSSARRAGVLPALKQDIVQLNPDAFIGGDPNKLLANKRLWLPGYMKQADTKADPDSTVVEHYSWGNIKRPRD